MLKVNRFSGCGSQRLDGFRPWTSGQTICDHALFGELSDHMCMFIGNVNGEKSEVFLIVLTSANRRFPESMIMSTFAIVSINVEKEKNVQPVFLFLLFQQISLNFFVH